MIDCNKVVRFIERKNNVKLSEQQKKIVRAIIAGDKIYTVRGIGRTMLYEGYADYLKQVLAPGTDYSISPTDFDSVFTLKLTSENYRSLLASEDYRSLKKIKNTSPEIFKREYLCDYASDDLTMSVYE